MKPILLQRGRPGLSYRKYWDPPQEILHEFIGGTSLSYKRVKSLNSKTQQVFYVNYVFDEVLVMEINTSSKSSPGYGPNTNQERWCQWCKGLSFLRMMRWRYSHAHSSYLCLAHIPLELDDENLVLDEGFQIAPPYSYGRDSSLCKSSHIHDHHEDGKLQA